MARFSNTPSSSGGSGSNIFDTVETTNNGNGTNVKIGDDAWIGDVNAANRIAITGVEDATKGGIVLGNGHSETIATDGSNLTIHASNDIVLTPGSTYAYIGTPQNDGSNRIATIANLPATVSLYYGSFEDTNDHISGGATSANLVTFSNTTASSGVSIVDNSKITFTNAGAYHFNILTQFFFSGGASNYNITLWYTKNGQPVTNTGFTFTTTGTQNAQVLGNAEDIIQVNAGDYIQFYWYSPATGMTLKTTAAGTNPTRPLSPSSKLNIFNVG
jgi:hypothetical protein